MTEIENKQRSITQDELVITKLFAYGIKDLQIIREILEDAHGLDMPQSKSLEYAINRYFLKETPASDRVVIQETLEIFLHNESGLEGETIKRNSVTLDRFGSLDLHIGRMSPSNINFSNKEWMVFERWARFDTTTTILSILGWGIVYAAILYYMYS